MTTDTREMISPIERCKKNGNYRDNIYAQYLKASGLDSASSLVNCNGKKDVFPLDPTNGKSLFDGITVVLGSKGNAGYDEWKEFCMAVDSNKRDMELNNLYASYGTLTGPEGNSMPVLLIECNISKNKGKISALRLNSPVINPAILSKLFSSENADVSTYSEIYEIRGSGPDEQLDDALRYLNESGLDLTEYKLEMAYHIGLFALSKEYIPRDLLLMFNEALMNRNTEILFGNVEYVSIPHSDVRIIFYADALDDSQLEAIKRIADGRSLTVIEGPPGTGKTMVICNSAVCEICQGGKVGMTSEKKAAIIAAYQRSKGLALNISESIDVMRNDLCNQATMSPDIEVDSDINEDSNRLRDLVMNLGIMCRGLNGYGPDTLRTRRPTGRIEQFSNKMKYDITGRESEEILEAASFSANIYPKCKRYLDIEKKCPWIGYADTEDADAILNAIETGMVEGMRPRGLFKRAVTFDKAFSDRFLGGKTVDIATLDTNQIREYFRGKKVFDGLSDLEKTIVSEAFRLDLASNEIVDKVMEFAVATYTKTIDDKYGVDSTVAGYRAIINRICTVEQRLRQYSLGLAQKKVSDAAKKLLSIPDFKADLLCDSVTKERFLRKWGRLIASVHPYIMGTLDDISHYIPLERNVFTLGIADESSQIDMERAAPFIYRAQRLVIVGDRKQMTTMKVAKTELTFGEDPFEQDLSLRSESLMDIGVAYEEPVTLRCSYRFKHKELGAFLNAKFYGGGLNLIDSSQLDGVVSEKPAISVIHVPDSRWVNQSNPKMIEGVIDYLRHLTMMGCEKKVRIVTGGSIMRDRMISTIQKSMSKEVPLSKWIAKTQDNLEEVVKNLENMQGLESDITIIALGFAPEEDGRVRKTVYHQFNTKGGAGRLCVAISRAKEEIVYFTAFGPGEMDVSGLLHTGAHLLKSWNDYAWAVSEGDTETVKAMIGSVSGNISEIPTDELTPELAKYLTDKGYRIRTNVSMGTDRIDIVAELNGRRGAIFFDTTDYCRPGEAAIGCDTSRVAYLKQHGFDVIDKVFSWSIYMDGKDAVFKDIEANLSNALGNELTAKEE